jgi:hypothetical protein
MNNKNNTINKDNKSLDLCKVNSKSDIWSTACLIDNIFNDLMDKKYENKNNNKINKYIYQAVTKFDEFRRKSSVTFFDISIGDLSKKTKNYLNDYIKPCNTQRKKYQKLNGIMTKVIALIYKQAESLILSNIEYEEEVWIKKTINEIRESIKKRWRFIKTDVY